MKKIVVLVLVTVLLISGLVSAPAQGATPDEIEESVDDGLAWLTSVQNPDGSWGNGERVATTGLVLIKLEDRAYELGKDPFDPSYEYSGNVTAGLNYILNRAYIFNIGTQTAGDPDTDGDGIGIAFYDYLSHSVYATGICLMALAGTRDPSLPVTTGPLSGNTTGEVVQDTVDWLAWAQSDPGGSGRGGWNYGPMNNAGYRSDNSISGYAVLGLDFAESPAFGFSATIPAFVKSELDHWIDYIQTDVVGANYGGSGYDRPNYWVNILKTGNLIYQMAFYGDSPTAQRVMDAVGYIERHWNHNDEPGFRPRHIQSMYCLMKGLERMGIDEITVDSSTVDWFDEISTIIVNSQLANGSWARDRWDPYNGRLTAAWALLTLEKVTPPSDIEVPVDIKPTSCPNPLNTKSKGVLPVAILGTEDLDVTQIDPASVNLTGAFPIRWALEDVAAPYDGEISDPADREDCTTEGPDGYLDLTLKFDKQEVVTAIGVVSDGDVIVLTLTGNLLEDFGGTAIIGQDVVWIKKKGK